MELIQSLATVNGKLHSSQLQAAIKRVNMKLLLMLTTLVAVTATYPTVETLNFYDLTFKLETRRVNSEAKPYYIEALDILLFSHYKGKNEEVDAILLTKNGDREWTEEELLSSIYDFDENPGLRVYLAKTLKTLQENKDKATIEVHVPALDISTWYASDIYAAIDDPNTKPALKPYLWQAKKELEKAGEAGAPKDFITIVTPVGLVPLENESDRRIVPINP